MGLEARIWASGLGFGPQDWDLGLETGIWASRLGFEGGGTKKKEKEKEKTPHMCESIGHRPLRGRCPKRGPTDQPTDRPTEQPTDQQSGLKSRVARD